MANNGLPPNRMPNRAQTQKLFGSFIEGSTYGLSYDMRTSQGKLASQVFSSDEEAVIARGEELQGAGQFYAPTEDGESNFDDGIDSRTVAFTETDIPTSSTNYARPRTVAAGYDANRQTMTVVFRDGTFYNYYGVSQTEWEAFHASYSKGRPWLNKASKSPKPGAQAVDGLFINKERGYADSESISPEIREQLYRIARTQQILHKKFIKPGKTTHAATKVFDASGKVVTAREPNQKASLRYKKNPGKNPARLTQPKQRKAS